MAIIDRNKPNNFETKLQPDPMLRAGRASKAWFWTVAGAIVTIVIACWPNQPQSQYVAE